MSREEVKLAINQILDKTSEEVLLEIFEYLKKFDEIPADKILLSQNLAKIIREDKNLLHRLAQ